MANNLQCTEEKGDVPTTSVDLTHQKTVQLQGPLKRHSAGPKSKPNEEMQNPKHIKVWL